MIVIVGVALVMHESLSPLKLWPKSTTALRWQLLEASVDDGVLLVQPQFLVVDLQQGL